MFVVDTNVLIYAADQDSPGHDTCLDMLLQWRSQASPWYLTWGIAYEFLRVATHPNVFRKPWTTAKAWRFIETLLDSPGLSVLTETQRHGDVLKTVMVEQPFVRGNLVFDAHTIALMYEHGVRTIYTHDADFRRFRGIEVIDPL